MSTFQDNIATIAARLRTKPRDTVFQVYVTNEQQKAAAVAAGDRNTAAAHDLVVRAARRVVTEHLTRELLPGTTTADRIAYLRNSRDQASRDHVENIAWNVIYDALADEYPDVYDTADDTFAAAYPHDWAWENWNRHLADCYAVAAGIEIPN